MLRFLADENFHGVILQAFRHQNPHLDIVRVQDVGPCWTGITFCKGALPLRNPP